jgi:hypothetical protein
MKELNQVFRTTLKTSEDENYTQNEWRWILHSKRVNMRTTLETINQNRSKQQSQYPYTTVSFQYDLPNKHHLIAGLPVKKHRVPSARGSWRPEDSIGIHRAFMELKGKNFNSSKVEKQKNYF